MEDKLDSLFAEYREACPDPEASANFMPQLWRRIEARRSSRFSVLLWRWAEVCIVATLTLTLLMSVYLIPHFQRKPVYQSTYLDVLAGTLDYTAVLPGGEER